MANVLMVVGLPGSGKTTYVKNLPDSGYAFFDDPAVSEENMGKVKKAVSEGLDVVITDVYCLSQNAREKAEKVLRYAGAKCVTWLFFDNNPDACINNVRRRNDGRSISEHTVRSMSAKYVIPHGAVVLPVFVAK